MKEAPLLAVDDLRVHYRLARPRLFGARPTLRAVDGVSLAVDRGRTLGLVGESGCGKTTLGMAVLRLVEPTWGRIVFDGVELRSLEGEALLDMRRRMQIVFQDPYSSLDPRRTAGDIVRSPLDVQKVGGPAQREERVAELFSRVGLRSNQRNLFPHQFSGGQRQRIAIARALALQPDFIVCDEPVSALDVAIQAQILNLLRDLQEELDLTFLFISHDLAVVQHICDEVAVMYLGVVVERTNRKALFRAPRHPYTRALLSAAPARRGSRRSERIRLEGDIPSPVDVPPGCRFHTRCAHARERCRVEVPELVEKAPGHWEACHFDTAGTVGQ